MRDGIYTLCSIIAAILSAALNQSFWWAVFHFICGPIYIIYVLCVRSHEVFPALKALFS